MELFAGIFALGLGFGLACWICGNMLNSSNNIGDSRGDGKTYNAKLTITSFCNNMDKSASTAYYNANARKYYDPNAPSDNAEVRRLTDKERKKKAVDDKKARVPKGAFVSKNTGGYSASSYERPDWEKRAEDSYRH